MLGVIATLIVGGLFVAAVSGDADEDGELEDTGAPTQEELEEDQVPIPTPTPTGSSSSSEPPPNYQVLREAAEFGPVQDAIEGNGGEPRTLYVGMSADWAGRLETVAELVELARDLPELNVRVFAFELTQELFGLPDSYLAYAATSVSPSGRVFETVLQSDRRNAARIKPERLRMLADFALEGYELPEDAELIIKRKPGDIDHVIAVWPEGDRWRWMFWRGSTVGTPSSARGQGNAINRAGAVATARSVVVSYKLGHAAGVPVGFG